MAQPASIAIVIGTNIFFMSEFRPALIVSMARAPVLTWINEFVPRATGPLRLGCLVAAIDLCQAISPWNLLGLLVGTLGRGDGRRRNDSQRSGAAKGGKQAHVVCWRWARRNHRCLVGELDYSRYLDST